MSRRNDAIEDIKNNAALSDDGRASLIKLLQGNGDFQSPETPSDVVMTFGEFADHYDGEHNLYIVWKDKLCLYVGISRAHIWGRWFASPNQHVRCTNPEYGSGIGQAIVRNMPASKNWTMELRYIDCDLRSWALEKSERELIMQLRPLFNGTHRPKFTDEEAKIHNLLLYGETSHIANLSTAKLKIGTAKK